MNIITVVSSTRIKPRLVSLLLIGEDYHNGKVVAVAVKRSVLLNWLY